MDIYVSSLWLKKGSTHGVVGLIQSVMALAGQAEVPEEAGFCLRTIFGLELQLELLPSPPACRPARWIWTCSTSTRLLRNGEGCLRPSWVTGGLYEYCVELAGLVGQCEKHQPWH